VTFLPFQPPVYFYKRQEHLFISSKAYQFEDNSVTVCSSLNAAKRKHQAEADNAFGRLRTASHQARNLRGFGGEHSGKSSDARSDASTICMHAMCGLCDAEIRSRLGGLNGIHGSGE
jgi:hypothetical protein